ncbi:MAG: hemerythrin domain-containing protein [Chloroflexota bacterium]
MSATEELKHEHQIIKRMLAVLDTAAARAEGGQALPPDFFSRAVDFIRNFADRCHHGKEEDNLYPAMERRGIPREGGPIGVMLVEHEQGRAYVKGMQEAGQRLAKGDRAALKEATGNARGYSRLLNQHIDKEDNILYAMADQVLSTTDQQELMAKFEEVERERIGPGKHHEYVKLVEDLERELGLT